MARSRSRTADAKPASDAYTGLLAISLVAMIIGCVLLVLDRSQYPESKPPAAPAAASPAK